MLLPREVVPQSEMTKTKWIAYKWEDVRTIVDSEAKYLCCGLRDISEAKIAEQDFEVWHKSIIHEVKLDKKGK